MRKTNNSLKLAKSLILLCIIAIIGLCSCELIMESKYGKPTYSKINILVYGNDYSCSPKFQGLTAKPLSYTINDATQVGLALEAWATKCQIECNALYVTGKEYTKKGGSDTIAKIPSEDKSDHDTSKTHFRTLMQDLAITSKEGELTFIYFSCHGYNPITSKVVKDYGAERDTAFVMCANSGTDEQCELYWHSEFKEDLEQIKGAKVVFADICYSGGLVDAGNVSINTAEYQGLTADQLFLQTDITELSNTFVLTASRYNEQAFESAQYMHGLFTNSLLKILCWDEEKQCLSDTPSGQLTFFNLCQKVIQDLSAYKNTQNPMLSGGSNDLVLFEL